MLDTVKLIHELLIVGRPGPPVPTPLLRLQLLWPILMMVMFNN